MATKDALTPFRIAFGGLVRTFRTQKHMRVHLYVTLITILGAILLNLQVREVLVLLFMINLVLVAEMFNSAIEATVDLVSPDYNPLAKFAKDISAGAVLITTLMALVVGTLVAVGEDAWERIKLSLTSESIGLPVVPRIILGLFALFIIVVIGKGLGKRGRVFQGGIVSGHAGVGFFLAGTIFFLTDQVVVSAIAILLALLIAQSRWEARFHSLFELSLGALVGVLLSIVLFGLSIK
jgi:diacylglycerol kinase (ATP)